MPLCDSLRQLKFPREFRIESLPWPDDLAIAAQEMAQAPENPADRFKEDAPKSTPELSVSLLADVGTGIWRLRQRMIEAKTGEPFEEMRRPFRHVQWIWDKLSDAGIEITDHTGERVPESGIYALKVVSYEKMPELLHDQVLETIKPTIYLNKNRIQMGEVIVGTSQKNQNS
ncbi:MAG TPA: hypothetical protein PKY55_02270 [bacterium]|nr:hypothetical protein [bacterium]